MKSPWNHHKAWPLLTHALRRFLYFIIWSFSFFILSPCLLTVIPTAVSSASTPQPLLSSVFVNSLTDLLALLDFWLSIWKGRSTYVSTPARHIFRFRYSAGLTRPFRQQSWLALSLSLVRSLLNGGRFGIVIHNAFQVVPLVLSAVAASLLSYIVDRVDDQRLFSNKQREELSIRT